MLWKWLKGLWLARRKKQPPATITFQKMPVLAQNDQFEVWLDRKQGTKVRVKIVALIQQKGWNYQQYYWIVPEVFDRTTGLICDHIRQDSTTGDTIVCPARVIVEYCDCGNIKVQSTPPWLLISERCTCGRGFAFTESGMTDFQEYWRFRNYQDQK